MNFKAWLVVGFVLVNVGLGWAQEPAMKAAMDPKGPMAAAAPSGNMGEGKGMMGAGMMCPMCAAKMKMMGQVSLATSGDGGVIVLMGNKLMKYDKDLNLVKEVDIKMVGSDLLDEMKDCPMCQQMKEKMQERREGMDEKMQQRWEMMEKRSESKQ